MFPKLSADNCTIREKNTSWFLNIYTYYLPATVTGQFNINQFKPKFRNYVLGNGPDLIININFHHKLNSECE